MIEPEEAARFGKRIRCNGLGGVRLIVLPGHILLSAELLAADEPFEGSKRVDSLEVGSTNYAIIGDSCDGVVRVRVVNPEHVLHLGLGDTNIRGLLGDNWNPLNADPSYRVLVIVPIDLAKAGSLVEGALVGVDRRVEVVRLLPGNNYIRAVRPLLGDDVGDVYTALANIVHVPGE